MQRVGEVGGRRGIQERCGLGRGRGEALLLGCEEERPARRLEEVELVVEVEVELRHRRVEEAHDRDLQPVDGLEVGQLDKGRLGIDFEASRSVLDWDKSKKGCQP